MARFRVKLDRAGMRALLTSAGVASELHRRAERAAAAARSAAPVDTGAYRASIHVEDGHSRSRARSRVVADVDYALVVEAKTRTLGRSIDAAKG